MNFTLFSARVSLLLSIGCGWAFGQPIITSFSPPAGAAGDMVTLLGSGFTTPGITVRFWQGQVVTAGFVNSDSQMTVTVPNGISTGPISIQQGAGAENFTAADFTAIGSGPYIIDVTPLYGQVNDSVVIVGVHFTGLTRTGVSFNGTNATDAAVNADGTHINVHVPVGATSGFISVTTPLGMSNSPAAFTVIGPGPFIVGFSPQVGTPGTTVFVSGVNLAAATNATFNGTPGVNFAAQSDTLIRVDAPPGVTSGPLTVNSPLGSFTTSSNFFVPPTVASFTPTAGRPGSNVVITGANFLGATAVSFNGLASATFTVATNTTISAVVPTGVATGLLRVTAPAGSAFSASNFVVQPIITGFSPTSGGPGTPVVITGANLNVGTPVIKFNGVSAAAPTGVTFGQLTALVPAGAITGPISVTTSDGSFTNANNFYLPASITGLTPTNSAPGSRVTVTGQNFTGTAVVAFNGVPAANFTVTNNTTLGATVPAGVTTGPISVTTPAGSTSSAKLFYGAPVITGFTPIHGLPGTNVTISGSSFLGATSVRFNGTNAIFTVLNNTQISATVPNGAVSGPITVVAPAGANTTSTNFVLDYLSDLAVSVTSSPNPVTVSSNLLYTIQVTNNGPLAAPNLRLTNMLPATVALVSAVAPALWSVSTNGNPIQAGVSTLAANASAALLLTVVPLSPGSITNTVSLGSDYSDPSPANNVASTTTSVSPLAFLSIQLFSNQVQLAWPVALTDYVLESRNTFATTASWASVSAPAIVSGPVKLVTITNLDTASFYRLRK